MGSYNRAIPPARMTSTRNSSNDSYKIVDRMFSLPIVSRTCGTVASLSNPYIQSMDDLACSGFDRVMEKVPYLQKPFPDLYQIGKDFAPSFSVGARNDWRVELANKAKELDEKEKMMDERENRMDARETKINNREKKTLVMNG